MNPPSDSLTFCESLCPPQGPVEPQGRWQSAEASQRVPEVPRHGELEPLGVVQRAPGLEQQGLVSLGVGAMHGDTVGSTVQSGLRGPGVELETQLVRMGVIHLAAILVHCGSKY